MQAAPRSAARWRLQFAVALLTLAFVFAACGGGDDDGDGNASANSAQEDVGAGDGIAPSSDTDVTGVNDRPDWAPVWLLIPEGLQLTLASEDSSLGESVIAGFLSDADLMLLYEQAKIMVQSGGYIIGDETGAGSDLAEPGASLSFSAEHTGDDGSVNFGVVRVDDQTTQWSMELVASGDTDGQSASDDSATSTNAADGAGTITVSAGGETFTTSGTCIIIDEGVIDQFASPVGTFVIISDDPPMANGYFFQPPGVSAVEWDIPNTAEGTVLEQTATSQHYEGPGILDDVDVDFIVDVECP